MSNLRELAYRIDPALWVRKIFCVEPTKWQEDFLRAPQGASILALTARQPHLPPGWNTHIRYYVAIHAGSGQGAAVSAGCLHATEADVRYLMRTVPLGTPVQISP